MSSSDSEASRDYLVLSPKHTVFLSHSRAQKGFVEQLDLDLRQCDRYPFFDKDPDSLPVGEPFPPLIFKAIRQCQVGVVILSEEFLTSKWPMLELVEMAKTMEDKPDQMQIMPIFHSISCADLGDEKKLSDWKEKWHVFAESDKRINISDWEKALKALKLLKATNGLVFNPGVREVKFREEIVKEICKIIPPFHRWDDSHVQGRLRLKQIIHKKIEETPVSTIYGVQVVGLYGVGGIGKTTACKLLHNTFDKEIGRRACHIEFGSGTEIDLLQKVLKKLTRTTHELLKELTIDECWARLKNVMQSQRVFLAIDNVSSNSKIIDQARNYLQAEYGHGSILVVTARSLGELENLKINASDCVPMPELEEDEAKDLFLYHVAKRKSEVDDEILMQCIKRCYFCKGNDRSHHYHPLALEVLGKQLGPSDAEEWALQLKEVDTFNQLRECENPVFSILRRSFDSLLPEDKLLFMDVAIFHSQAIPSGFWEVYSDYDLEDKAYWNIFEWLSMVNGGSGDDVKKRLDTLKRKSLLEEVDDGASRIGIHDLWWEFALMESKVGDVERRRWVYEFEDSEGEESSRGSSLYDEGEESSHEFSIHSDPESRRSNLFGDGEGDGEDSSLSEDFSLSGDGEDSSLSTIPDDSSLASEGEETSESAESSLPDEVEVVESSLSDGGWENLLRISVTGKAVSQNRVKCINFCSCSKVTVLRLANANVENSELNLSGLKQVKILEIVCSEDFFGNSFANVSGIEQVTNLRVLIWMKIGIDSISAVEQISNLTKLQVLQLNFAELREVLQLKRRYKDLLLNLGPLRSLRVARFQFEGKFTISGLSSTLRVLDLAGCNKLRICPDVSRIVGLEVLVLRECKKLEQLPNLRRLKNLLILDIEHCESLTAVTGLGSLVALQELLAEACHKLQALPDMSKLTNLRTLDVKNCDSLECIPGMANLIALQIFIASTGKFLEDWPDRGRWTKLETAEIYGPDVIERDGESSQAGDEGSKEEDDLSGEEYDVSQGDDLLSQGEDESNPHWEDDEWDQGDDESNVHWEDYESSEENRKEGYVPNQEDVESIQEDDDSSQDDDECTPLEFRPVLNLAILESVLTLTLERVNHEPMNLSKLTRLEDLYINNCGFKTLPGLSYLTAMKSLDLHNSSLKRLPDMGKHMVLESLKIWGCKRLRGWDGVRRLGSSESHTGVSLQCDWTLLHLETLRVSFSPASIELPDLSQLPRLRELILESARRRRSSIPEFALNCSADHLHLEILHCIDWPIVKLPDLNRFPRLKVLKLDAGARRHRSDLPDFALHCLTDHLQLEILHCCAVPIIDLPDLSKFPSLKKLKVEGCLYLKSLISSGPLTALEALHLKYCPSLKALPGVCLFPGLRKFCIAKCGVTLNVQDVEALILRCPHLRVDNSSWKSGHLVDKSLYWWREPKPGSESVPDSGLGLLAPDGTEDLVAGLVSSGLIAPDETEDLVAGLILSLESRP